MEIGKMSSLYLGLFVLWQPTVTCGNHDEIFWLFLYTNVEDLTSYAYHNSVCLTPKMADNGVRVTSLQDATRWNLE